MFLVCTHVFHSFNSLTRKVLFCNETKVTNVTFSYETMLSSMYIQILFLLYLYFELNFSSHLINFKQRLIFSD